MAQFTPDTATFDFCSAVDRAVEEQHDIQDGGDLCLNLIASGVITKSMTINQAAAIVAQHIQQA